MYGAWKLRRGAGRVSRWLRPPKVHATPQIRCPRPSILFRSQSRVSSSLILSAPSEKAETSRGREPSAAPRPPRGVTPHPVRCSRRSRSRTASSRRERTRAPPGDPGFRVEFTARFAIVGQTQQRAGTPPEDRTPPRTMSPRTPSMPPRMSRPCSWWASTRTRSSP